VVIDGEKLKRDARELYYHWGMVERRDPGARDFASGLSRIGVLSGEIARRAGETGLHPAIGSGNAVAQAARALARALETLSGESAEVKAAVLALAAAVATLQQVLPPMVPQPLAAPAAFEAQQAVTRAA
jgi:hypothetical protein